VASVEDFVGDAGKVTGILGDMARPNLNFLPLFNNVRSLFVTLSVMSMIGAFSGSVDVPVAEHIRRLAPMILLRCLQGAVSLFLVSSAV
jgi:hypothetical protein